MIKKLGHILTYHDSEPTEIIQGLIWLIFAPAVLMMENFHLWYIGIMSSLIGFGTLYSVVYSKLERRKLFAYLYGIMSILFIGLHFYEYDPYTWSHMNWGWVVISISALSNIRRINQKIKSKKQEKIKDDISKMYREDLEEKIKEQMEVNFNLRMENIKLNDKLKQHKND